MCTIRCKLGSSCHTIWSHKQHAVTMDVCDGAQGIPEQHYLTADYYEYDCSTPRVSIVDRMLTTNKHRQTATTMRLIHIGWPLDRLMNLPIQSRMYDGPVPQRSQVHRRNMYPQDNRAPLIGGTYRSSESLVPMTAMSIEILCNCRNELVTLTLSQTGSTYLVDGLLPIEMLHKQDDDTVSIGTFSVPPGPTECKRGTQ